MLNKLKTYSSFFLCVILLYSCNDRPRGVLNKQEMEDALYDVYLTQALIQTNSRYATPEAKDSLLGGILAKHNITQAQFDSSIVWYSRQGEIYYKLNDKVSKRLQDLQKEIAVDQNSDANGRKKYDGFTLPPSVLIGAKGSLSSFGFEIDSLKFGQIDTLVFDFNFKTLGITQNSKVNASLCFEYKDTTIYKNEILNQNTYYSIKKPVGIRHKLKKISGYIHMDNPNGIFPPVYLYELNYRKQIQMPNKQPPRTPNRISNSKPH